MSTLAPILIRVLALLPNLRSITILDCVEEIVFHASDFALTILNRPHLDYIDLRDASVYQALQGWHTIAELDEVLLNLTRPQQEDLLTQMELIPGKGMASILFHARGDLTDLLLEKWDLRSMLYHETLKKCSDDIKTPIIFPKVVTLDLSDCDVSLIGLASAFPALCTLKFGYSEFLHNVAPQQNPTICFPDLISIQGRYKDIQAFLQSTTGHAHVHRVVVDSTWTPKDNEPLSL
ncbi:hypothetical protein GALMADRAFT_135317 [Galerina marginata CBS 339.88]|uniref:F-box domain-containing protein n=1 Tax=Galerina marginata (strain CBS 339.88) TaxID=685588 RepID=A0A067TSM0_GALM3|nr:hypothetical protein GALMADRAFT_135317 [Galerina marginata CBS 339.88]